MFMQSYNIGGYFPGFTEEQPGKQSQELHVVDGSNFIWNMNGVESCYGTETRRPPVITGMRHPSIQWIKNDEYLFTLGIVYKWNGDDWQTVFTYTPQTTEVGYDLEAYRWSYAYVGTRHWFAHPLAGLLYFDEFSSEWGTHWFDCFNYPIFGITHADNRLVFLLQDVVAWSAVDRGDIWTEEWECGAGAQSLALLRYGQPYAVLPYRGGFNTFTSMGVMTSQISNSQAIHPDGRRVIAGALVFNHTASTFNNLPLGPACITHADEKENYWLSRDGFYQASPSQGGGFISFTPWQVPMSRFIRESILEQLPEQNIRLDYFQLTYVSDLNWLYLSAPDPNSLDFDFYETSLVYQFTLDKWHVFERPHVEIARERARNTRDTQTTDPYFLSILDPGGAQVVLSRNSLDARSWVKFGTMRLQAPNEELPASTVSSVQQVRLGVGKPSWETKTTGQLSSKWQLAKSTLSTPSTFKLLFASSNGPVEQLDDEIEYGILVERSQTAAIYAVHSTGIAHTILITAEEPNEEFDIRHIELSFFWAGVL